LRRTLGTLLLGWLSHDGVPKADRTAVAELFASPIVLEAPYVFAHGPIGDAASGGGAPSPVPTWTVTGIGGPPEPAVALVRKFLGIWNRAAIQRWTRKTLMSLESTAGNAAGTGSGLTASWRTTQVPKQLPKGTLAYVATWVPFEQGSAGRPAGGSAPGKGTDRSKAGADAKSKAVPSKPVNIYLFVVPTADATWIGTGTDTSALTARLQSVTAPSADAAAILSQPELNDAATALRSQPSLSGGYWTLRGLFDQIRAAHIASQDDTFVRALDRLASLPHRAETPMIFDLRPLDPATGTISAEFHVPKAVVEDLTAIGLRALVSPGLGKGGPLFPPGKKPSP
jgi:hypothetical protein